MTDLIVIGCIFAYLCIGAWTFGFSCGRHAANYNEKHGYDSRSSCWYHDDPGPWFAAIFWPLYITSILLFKKLVVFLVMIGEGQVEKSVKAKRLRIEIEKKIRVEKEKIEREAQEEIEEALRQEEAAD